MSSHAPATTGPTCKIYRVRSVYHHFAVWIVVLLLPLFALIPVVMIGKDLNQAGTISVGSIIRSFGVVIGGMIALWMARHARATSYLLLSANGLEYYGPGITIKTSWQNTKEIASGSGLPSLILHRPAATYLSPLVRRDLYTDRRIPLYLFEYTSHSELARDLRHYAPHLFVQGI